jgi:hypothetical protein
MTLNPNAKIPPFNVLIISREGVRRELDARRKNHSKQELNKLEAIYDQLTFIIKST